MGSHINLKTFDLRAFGKKDGLSRGQKIALLFAGWTFIGLFMAIPDPFLVASSNWRNVLSRMIQEWVWACLSPLVLLIVGKVTSLSQHAPVRIAVLFAISVPFALGVVCIDGVIMYPLKGFDWDPLKSTQYFYYYFNDSWMTYCAVASVVYAASYYKRYVTAELRLERAEKQLLQSHLNALRLQLEPHFLFNGLNSISSVLDSNVSLARRMLEHLCVLLRSSLEFSDRNEIPLTEEVALLEHYLAIQRARFGNRLKVEMDIDPEVRFALVPCVLLQPLVENAIRHGLSKSLSGGTVQISAKAKGPDMEIKVQDDGVGLPPGWTLAQCSGVGLRVTRERITGYYSNHGGRFEVCRRAGTGTEVVISVPIRMVGDNA